MRLLFKALLLVGLFSFGLRPISASASPAKEFIMSCTYGVLAGTLVGAATLAFTDQPGDNLNKVARGASLGLYAGIALGLYVVYIVPDGDVAPEEQGLPPEEGTSLKRKAPPIAFFPMLSEQGSVDGLAATARLLEF